MKAAIRWLAVLLVAAAVLGVAHDPLYWRRQAIAFVYGPQHLPAAFFQPRDLVAGGHRPPAPREPPATESLDPSALEAAATYAGNHHSDALIVSRHGYIVFERYWRGTGFDTVIDSQGLARVLTALAACIAVTNRNIGWPDEPISYFLPEWHDDPRGAITIRSLMQLSSGLTPPTSALAPRATYGTDIIGEYLKWPLVALPGRRWNDQSVDSDLLAFVIERATRERYAQFVSRTIWRRIGAGDAWLWLDRPAGAAHTDRGFFARQGDWIRVADLLLNNGNYQGDEVVRPQWVPQLLRPAKSNPDYGAYIRLGAHPAPGMSPYATDDVFLIAGGGNRLWLIPSLQIAILRTAPDMVDWDDGSIPNLIIRGTHDFVPREARPGADLSKIVPNH